MIQLPYLGSRQIAGWADRALSFCYSYNIQDLVLGQTVDHIAVKLANRNEYDKYLKLVRDSGHCTSLTYTSMKDEDRDLATAVLDEPVEIVSSDGVVIGLSTMLEIMEPRPAKANGKDIIGLEHIEVLVPDHKVIIARLKEGNVPMEEGRNDYHHTVVVQWIGADGEDGHMEEIKFTERPLSEVIRLEEADGTVTRLI